MRFEECLSKMREGEKIRHPYFDSDVYFQACRVGIKSEHIPISEMPISIVKMKGEYQHPDMGTSGSFENMPGKFDKPCKHGNYPQLNLLLIMSDDWEVMK